MGDSLSWAADQERDLDERRREEYRKTAEYQEVLARKQEYERLLDKPLPPVAIKQLEFLMEKPRGGLHLWPETVEAKFYTRERLERVKTIYGFYDLDL